MAAAITSKGSNTLGTLKEIGSAAGEVWRYLDSNGAATASAIKRKTKLPSDVFYAALGWLAREGKLKIEADGKQIMIELK